MAFDFDLLGDPIPEGWGRRGRPAHVPTDENRRKVVALMAFDKNEEQIAAALGITPPTLRKHYFRELKARLEARQRIEGKLISALLAEIDKGNVSAIDKLWKRLDRHDMIVGGQRQAKAAKPPKPGKKEQAVQAAHSTPDGSPWGGLLRH